MLFIYLIGPMIVDKFIEIYQAIAENSYLFNFRIRVPTWDLLFNFELVHFKYIITSN